MAITVTRGGMLTTIQDLGRGGWRRWGVAASGPLDLVAHRVANALVGNEERAAALEITCLGPSLRFDGDSLLAVCGGEIAWRADGAELPLGQPVWIPAGTEVRCGAFRRGFRATLAVAGGISVPPTLESRSTTPTQRLGGLHGLPLQSGDRLPVAAPSAESQQITQQLACRPVSGRSWVAARWGVRHPLGDDRKAWVPGRPEAVAIRILPGRQQDWFSSEDWRRLGEREFTVSSQSNRVGLRLQGVELQAARHPNRASAPARDLEATGEFLSEAVAPGAVQVPPSGQPIILLADGPPTGGYPKIAQVVAVDLGRLAQIPPGCGLRFVPVTIAEARVLWHRREEYFRRLRVGLRFAAGRLRDRTWT